MNIPQQELIRYGKIISIVLLAGAFLAAWYNEWIIIRLPWHQQAYHRHTDVTDITKKKVTLWYWHRNRWHKEETEIMWSEHQEIALQHLVTVWLSLMDEEHIIDKKASLQTALLAENRQDAYLSFDCNILPENTTTFHKAMLLESLLKTIRENNVAIERVTFLVHHQPLDDLHLDCSNPWPLQGFLPQIGDTHHV